MNSRATALLIAESEASYGASKNALESYTMAAWELGRHGTTANLPCPPATDIGSLTLETASA